MSKLSRHIQIVIAQDKGKELDNMAKENGLPTSTLVRLILYRFLAKHNK